MIGRPPIYDSPEQLEKAVTEYLTGTLQKDLTITGLALYLGFESRQSIYDYEENPVFSYIIKRAKLHIENAYEMKLSGNNATGPIFALKNMKWDDKTQVEQSGGLVINWQEERTYETK